MPELAPDCVLVKTMAVALNPTDWKHIDFISTKGATVGCDYAGIIQELGPEVDPSLGLQVGDRVAGFTHGCNGENLSDGSFAEYIVAKAHINIRLPDWLPFTEGVSLAVGITTVAQGLYQQLKMPLPLLPTPSSSSSHELILIYGGSTATGTLAIQFAKLSGYRVITTCSPHNFPLVLDRGADHVLDHHSPTLAQEIRALTNNGRELFLVFDCITTVGELPRSDVEAGFTMAYTALGESFQKWDNFYPGRKEDARFIGDFMNLTSKLLEKKMIRAHPVEVGSGGLEGVLGGLERLRRGEVSGLKLVYTV
ncbi:chaperonin 10-like protein [Aspergillus desertorum]